MVFFERMLVNWFLLDLLDDLWFLALLELVLDEKVGEENNEGEHIPEQTSAEAPREFTVLHPASDYALDTERYKLEQLHVGNIELPPCEQKEYDLK